MYRFEKKPENYILSMLQPDGSWLLHIAISKRFCSVDHIISGYLSLIHPESPFSLVVDGMILLSKSTEHGRQFIMHFTKAEGFSVVLRVIEKGVVVRDVRLKTYEEMVQEANQMF